MTCTDLRMCCRRSDGLAVACARRAHARLISLLQDPIEATGTCSLFCLRGALYNCCALLLRVVDAIEDLERERLKWLTDVCTS